MARFGSFEFDAARRRLARDGREVHLKPKAFDLLALLIEAAPRVVPKAELHERLWPRGIVSDATLVGLVKEIRRALGDRGSAAPLIRTAHRVGYAFDAPLEAAPRPTATRRWLVASGRRVVLAAGENLIGRDPDASLQLEHSTVSRRHARITVGDARAVLEDLGSKNGTCVGDTPLSGKVDLRDGDRLSFGRIVVTYREAPDGPSTATQLSRAGVPYSSLER
jgi:DNA-binding winged helix-turn-helix (wHTH) protein